MKGRNISFIIPAYNAEKTIGKLLDSLFGQKYSGKLEVLVIDDRSEDMTWELLKRRKERNLRLFKNRENSGFAASVNRAIKLAKYDILGVMESDCMFLRPDWLEKMSSLLASSRKIAVVSSEWRYSEDSWKALDFWAKIFFVRKNMEGENGGLKAFSETRRVSMKGCLIKRSVLEKVGFLDLETFRTGGEDVDIGMRIHKAGYTLLMSGKDMEVLHMHAGGEMGIRGYLFKRSQYAEMKGVLLRKHGFDKPYTGIGSIVTILKRYTEIFYLLAIFSLFFAEIRWFGVIFIAAMAAYITFIASQRVAGPKLFLVPPVRVIGDVLAAFYFVKGFITGKQRL